MNHTLRTLIPLFALCAVLVGHSYTSGQWAEPSTAPTGGNAAAPLNVSGTGQIKSGTLGVGGLDVTGAADVTGRVTVENVAPTVYLRDTNSARSSFVHQNNDTFYVLSDRNNDGGWDTDGSWPMQISIGATAGSDLVSFSNRVRVEGPNSEVRANRYCNYNASSCFDPANVDTPIGEGQWWQTPARSAGVTYVNNTGRPIQVAITFRNENRRFQLSYDGVNWFDMASGGGGSGEQGNVNVIVPNGMYYRITATADIWWWRELRN